MPEVEIKTNVDVNVKIDTDMGAKNVEVNLG
jgi:hypothetical protein